eukprot:TRINITY_DN96810_c0_g1_i1.p1 TRINITY_DN96810_c0_g1~~TRINITY_DN96810_c0_g1_i1.p1  ORF type:complete len:186 (+),score=12.72 TRINITY_DN96810_c0_g1_i1:49-606(+)
MVGDTKQLAGTYRDPWPVCAMPHPPTSRRHFEPSEQHYQWDYLKSGRNYGQNEDEKGKPFKIGWKRLKSELSILPYNERQEQTKKIEARQQIVQNIRHDFLEQKNKYNAYDPIKGLEYNVSTKEWQPCALQTASFKVSHDKSRNITQVQKDLAQAQWEARKDLVEREGLFQTKKNATMRQILNWE